jgi:hypothetical protein
MASIAGNPSLARPIRQYLVMDPFADEPFFIEPSGPGRHQRDVIFL